MEDIIENLKAEITKLKVKIVEILDEIDEAKSKLKYSDANLVCMYSQLHHEYDVESQKLYHMRRALVELYHSEGKFNIDTFFPEIE